MTADLRKLNMKNKSKREKSGWFSACNSGMHDRTWGNPLSNIKPLGSKRAWWLFLEVVVGTRGAQHSECDVWQWGTGVQRTPLAINHDHKRLLQRRCSCDKCLLLWHLLAEHLRSCQNNNASKRSTKATVQFHGVLYLWDIQEPPEPRKDNQGRKWSYSTFRTGEGFTMNVFIYLV